MLKDKRLDKRLQQRYLDNRTLEPDTLAAHLDALPDVSHKAAPVTTPQPTPLVGIHAKSGEDDES